MEHTWHSCNDEDCFVCGGGLSHCAVCGEAEAWLPTECPGEKIPFEKGELIGKGLLDFVNGRWVERIGRCSHCGSPIGPLDVDHEPHHMSAANDGWDGVCTKCRRLWKEPNTDGSSIELDPRD